MSAEKSPARDNEDSRYRIAGRLADLVREAGGPARVAGRSGIPLRTLKSYISAESEPKLSTIIQILDAADVGRVWFWQGLFEHLEPEIKIFDRNDTGNPDHPASPLEAKEDVEWIAPINRQLLAQALQLAEEFQQREGGRSKSVTEKAEAVTEIYSLLLEDQNGNTAPLAEQINRILKALS